MYNIISYCNMINSSELMKNEWYKSYLKMQYKKVNKKE